jgi:hypothetical protein
LPEKRAGEKYTLYLICIPGKGMKNGGIDGQQCIAMAKTIGEWMMMLIL